MIIPRKNVAEEDVKATEARLSESYAGFKQALLNIPSETARPMTDTVRAHPYISVALAVGAGFVAYQILDLLIPRTKVITHEVSVHPEIEVKEKKRRSLASRLLSEAVTLITPYVTGYMQSEMSRLLAKPGEGKPDKKEM